MLFTMKAEIIPFAGWQRNLRLFNNQVEWVVTLDVGPRILSGRTPNQPNIFANFSEQMGGQGEKEWKIRGGHRLWIAPEDLDYSYDPDNAPVEIMHDKNTHILVAHQQQGLRVKKTLALTPLSSGAGLLVHHTLTNEEDHPVSMAAWGLSVMAPGGTEIIPQPPFRAHGASGLLPNRNMVLWPYTDLSDPRWRLGKNFILLEQRSDSLPTKMGLTHRERWVAYLLGRQLFIKECDYEKEAVYPDGGCNFETFSNSDFLEIESLSPLQSVKPGASVSHSERWHLFGDVEPVDLSDEEALSKWILPYVEKTGM